MNNRPNSTGDAGSTSHTTDPSAAASANTPLHSPLPLALSPLSNVQATLTYPNSNTLPPEKERDGVDCPAVQEFVTGLLTHAGVDLPPTDWPMLSAKPRSPADAHAISAALGCPDLFLIGSCGIAFLADLTREAARLCSRVLVVTPCGEIADTLLASLIRETDCEIGRALADCESVEHLPTDSATRTEAASRQTAVSAAQQRCRNEIDRLSSQDRLIQELVPLLEQLAQEPDASHTPDADELTRNREQIPNQVRAELEQLGDSPFARTIRQAREDLALELQRLDLAIQEASTTLEQQSQELTRLREDLDSPPAGSGLIGRLKGLFSKPDPIALARQEQTAHEIESVVQSLTDNLARLTAERVSLEAKQQTAIELFVVAEITRRQDDIDAVLTAMRTTAEKRTAREQAAGKLLATLHIADVYPTDPAEQILIRDRVNKRHDALKLEQANLQARIRAITSESVSIACPPIIIGPVNALSDPFLHTQVNTVSPAQFDLVIFAGAERLSDEEFYAVSPRGRRWILVGDPAGSAQRGNRSLRPGLFIRLWQRLYRRTWSREGQRRVARLAEVSFRDTVHTEPLADRPEIELRFTESVSDGRSLAAVLFPPTLSAADVKTFLAQELDEIRLATLGPLDWEEQPEWIRATWPIVAEWPGSAGSAELIPGVTEQIVDTGTDILTVSIVFDRAAGWNRASAEEWIAIHTRPSCTARTALADRPQPTPTHSL